MFRTCPSQANKNVGKKVSLYKMIPLNEINVNGNNHKSKEVQVIHKFGQDVYGTAEFM